MGWLGTVGVGGITVILLLLVAISVQQAIYLSVQQHFMLSNTAIVILVIILPDLVPMLITKVVLAEK